MTRRSLEGLEVEQRGLQSEITKSEDGERTRTMALFESYDQPLSSCRLRAREQACVEVCQWPGDKPLKAVKGRAGQG